MTRLPLEEPSPSHSQVLDAFARLARRYPPVSFPERFRELIQGRDLRLDPSRDLLALCTARHLDLSFLPALVPTLTGAADDDWDPQRRSLLDLLRAAYTSADEL